MECDPLYGSNAVLKQISYGWIFGLFLPLFSQKKFLRGGIAELECLLLMSLNINVCLLCSRSTGLRWPFCPHPLGPHCTWTVASSCSVFLFLSRPQTTFPSQSFCDLTLGHLVVLSSTFHLVVLSKDVCYPNQLFHL